MYLQIGNIRACRVFSAAPDGGRRQGCGFVSFALAEDAQRAVQELHDHQLGGRTIQALPAPQSCQPLTACERCSSSVRTVTVACHGCRWR